MRERVCGSCSSETCSPPVSSALTHHTNWHAAAVCRCVLALEIGGKPAGQLQLGLWRDAAPSTVDAFVSMCNGQLFVPATEAGGAM
jgi:hypothetical protein